MTTISMTRATVVMKARPSMIGAIVATKATVPITRETEVMKATMTSRTTVVMKNNGAKVEKNRGDEDNDAKEEQQWRRKREQHWSIDWPVLGLVCKSASSDNEVVARDGSKCTRETLKTVLF